MNVFFFWQNFRQLKKKEKRRLVGRMVMSQISNYFFNGLEMLER
jgi:hypothetical protein